MANHFLDCLTMQWYSLPTTPCTCPPWVGLDPDGWYRLDAPTPPIPGSSSTATKTATTKRH